jgi:hypothetical protein
MHKPFVYRELDIPNYQEIHCELHQLALAQQPLFSWTFNHLDLALTLDQCPGLAAWFRSHRLEPRASILILQPPGADHKSVHTDTTQDLLALNFGISNLQDTWCAFYTLTRGSPVLRALPPGPAWQHYPSADLEEIGRVDLIKPTLINVAVPHCVHNPTQAVRISVSFRFKQNPWHLI